MRHFLRYKLDYLPVTLLTVLAVIFMTAGTVSAIARGYKTNDSGLQTGMVVSLSLDPVVTDTVERATQDGSERVVGVVTTLDKSLVTVSSSNFTILVESEGEIDSYVSDLGGEVHKGDLLTLSPLKGILMKSSSQNSSTVVAVASSATAEPSSYSVQVNGHAQQTQVSKVKISINRNGSKSSGHTASDSPLARIGRTLVGKEVSEVRVLIAMMIFLIVLVVEGAIIYAAISSAITALGRNPLAKKSIRAQFLRIIAIAIVVLMMGLGAVYAFIWF